MITNIPCVILCGGKSSRMGEDKSLLPFGKFDTLLEYQYDKLSKIFTNVYFSTKQNKSENFTFLTDQQKKSLLIYDNINSESSPMIALSTIFNKLDCQKIFIVTVDVPFVNSDTFKLLVNSSKNSDITIAKVEDRVHNLCGVFNKNILDNIESCLDQGIHKINYLIKQTNSFKELLFPSKKEFLNINTQEHYQEALDNLK